MSDDASALMAEAGSPGALLRRAREAAGLELGTLSATIKVAQRKLEALEGDRYDELPDAVFIRALALAVCRALKIDPAPVLAQLPVAREAQGLEHVTQGLNQPFDERGGLFRRVLKGSWGGLLRPSVLAPLCLVGGAAALYWWPYRKPILGMKSTPVVVTPAPVAAERAASDAMRPSVGDSDSATDAPPPASEPPDVSPNAGEFAPATPVAHSGAVASSAARVVDLSASAVATSPGAVAPIQPMADGDALALKTTEDSWVEVRDASGRVLLSRLVHAGEALSLNGAAPLQVKIGNAHGTELQFRGRAVDVSAAARDNVARLELK